MDISYYATVPFFPIFYVEVRGRNGIRACDPNKKQVRNRSPSILLTFVCDQIPYALSSNQKNLVSVRNRVTK